MNFKCNACGLCCQHIKGIKQLEELDRGDGVCKFLKNDLCSIYKNRPDICNVEIMYHKEFHLIYSKEEYVKENMDACERLKKAGVYG